MAGSSALPPRAVRDRAIAARRGQAYPAGRIFTRHLARAFFWRTMIATLAASVLTAGMIAGVHWFIDREIGRLRRVSVSLASEPANGENVLIVGSDSRAFVDTPAERESFGTSGGQRADTMIVAHIVPGGNTFLVSLPRDLLVDIPGAGPAKLNAAFNKGPNELVATLRATFGIRINHYVQVDFRSFEGVVDALGTVPVYFPYATRDLKTGLAIPNGGCWQLNGQDALRYVRARSLEYSGTDHKWVSVDTTPDIDRIQRQQHFIRTLVSLAMDEGLSDPLTARDVAEHLTSNLIVDRSLTTRGVLDLIDVLRTAGSGPGLHFETMPWTDGPPLGTQRVLYAKAPDWHRITAQLRDFTPRDRADTIRPSSLVVAVRNATDRNGLGSDAERNLHAAGFRDGGLTDDIRGQIAKTEVRYRPGYYDAARVVARFIDPTPTLVSDQSLSGANVVLVVGSDFRRTTKDPRVPLAFKADVSRVTLIAEHRSSQEALGSPAPIAPPCDANETP